MKILLTALVFALFTSSLHAVQGPGDNDSKDPFEGLQRRIAATDWTFSTTQQPMSEAEGHVLAGMLSQKSGVTLIYDPDRSNQNEMVFTNDLDASTIMDLDLRSRGFLFNAGMNGLRNEGNTPNLPDAAQARKAAMQELRSLGLVPPRGQRSIVDVGGLNMAVVREDGSTDDYRKLVSVRLARNVGSADVQGPGSRILVHLGEAGRLQGLIWLWERSAAKPIAEGDKVPAVLIRKVALQRLAVVAPHAVAKRIDTVELVYFDDGRGVMEPAIHIVAQLTLNFGGQEGEELRDNPFDFYLPMLRTPLAYYPFMEDQGIPDPNDD